MEEAEAAEIATHNAIRQGTYVLLRTCFWRLTPSFPPTPSSFSFEHSTVKVVGRFFFFSAIAAATATIIMMPPPPPPPQNNNNNNNDNNNDEVAGENNSNPPPPPPPFALRRAKLVYMSKEELLQYKDHASFVQTKKGPMIFLRKEPRTNNNHFSLAYLRQLQREHLLRRTVRKLQELKITK